jgi:hypothetical protein
MWKILLLEGWSMSGGAFCSKKFKKSTTTIPPCKMQHKILTQKKIRYKLQTLPTTKPKPHIKSIGGGPLDILSMLSTS